MIVRFQLNTNLLAGHYLLSAMNLLPVDRPPNDKSDGLCSEASVHQSRIFATTPAPTVRPPSRIAKRRPCSIATGWISFTLNVVLSPGIDRKSTRLNSSHVAISYAVFCLK